MATHPPLSNVELLHRAQQARQAGDLARAIDLLQHAVRQPGAGAAAFNMLGLSLIAARRPAEAIGPLRRAIAIDPGSAPLHLNLADALREAGDAPAALDALDWALERDPYLLPALLWKGQLLEASGRTDDALRAYRALLKTMPEGPPPPMADAIAHARRMVAADGAARLARLEAALVEHGADALSPRARAYSEQLCGTRRIYQPQPTGPHFPFLPALEYFDDAQFPWFATLEAAYPVIRDELLALWREDVPGFDPYVRFDPTMPVNQWSELNHSPRWSAFFLWRDGMRVEENIRRCPGTAAAMEALPLLDVPGKSPTVIFSILAPRTRIPAHTGVSNTRATVHLPLVVPEGCRFRVGGETRPWVEGRAWAFDDTIEHEAWNDSDRPRAILIIDAWNPFLDEGEKAVVRTAAPHMRL